MGEKRGLFVPWLNQDEAGCFLGWGEGHKIQHTPSFGVGNCLLGESGSKKTHFSPHRERQNKSGCFLSLFAMTLLKNLCFSMGIPPFDTWHYPHFKNCKKNEFWYHLLMKPRFPNTMVVFPNNLHTGCEPKTFLSTKGCLTTKPCTSSWD